MKSNRYFIILPPQEYRGVNKVTGRTGDSPSRTRDLFARKDVAKVVVT